MKKYFILFYFLSSYIVNCFGFGAAGHKLIGRFCESILEKRILDSCSLYLKSYSIESGSTWMDEVRMKRGLPNMSSWHYINASLGTQYVPGLIIDAYSQINYSLNILKNRYKFSAIEVKQNLLVLIHLIEDLHQPLHCGNSEDAGGNKRKIYINFGYTNLHSFYDTYILNYSKPTLNSLQDRYVSLNKDTLKLVQTFTIKSIIDESRALLPDIYNFDKYSLNASYISKQGLMINNQIFKAGVRLAFILTDIFK